MKDQKQRWANQKTVLVVAKDFHPRVSSPQRTRSLPNFPDHKNSTKSLAKMKELLHLLPISQIRSGLFPRTFASSTGR